MSSSSNTSTDLAVMLRDLREKLKRLYNEASGYFWSYIIYIIVAVIVGIVIVAAIFSVIASLASSGAIQPGSMTPGEITRLVFKRISNVFIASIIVLNLAALYVYYRAYRLGLAYRSVLMVAGKAGIDAGIVFEKIGLLPHDIDRSLKSLGKTPEILLVSGVFVVVISMLLGVLTIETIIRYGLTGPHPGLLIVAIISLLISIYLAVLFYRLFHSISLGLKVKAAGALSILFPIYYIINGLSAVLKANTLQAGNTGLDYLNLIILLLIIGYLYSFKKSLREFPDAASNALAEVEGRTTTVSGEIF